MGFAHNIFRETHVIVILGRISGMHTVVSLKQSCIDGSPEGRLPPAKGGIRGESNRAENVDDSTDAAFVSVLGRVVNK
jgi:hypothetical protein